MSNKRATSSHMVAGYRLMASLEWRSCSGSGEEGGLLKASLVVTLKLCYLLAGESLSWNEFKPESSPRKGRERECGLFKGWPNFRTNPRRRSRLRSRSSPWGSCVTEHPRGKRYHNEIKVSEPACQKCCIDSNNVIRLQQVKPVQGT